jgi:hypothetical protein
MCAGCNPKASAKSRIREAQMAATLQRWAEDKLIRLYTLWNKQNPMADPMQCGKYRPDFVFEGDAGVVIVEYDEQQHKDRIKRCELVRQAEASLGFGKPTVWIRYNPDVFKVGGDKLTVPKKKRETLLLETLQKYIDNANWDFNIQVVYICYDKLEISGDSRDLIQTLQFATYEGYEKWVDEVAPA